MNLYAMNQLEDGNYHFFPEKGDEQINRVRIIGLIMNYWTDYELLDWLRYLCVQWYSWKYIVMP